MKSWFSLGFFILTLLGCANSETKKEEKQETSIEESKLPKENIQPLGPNQQPQEEIRTDDGNTNEAPHMPQDTLIIGKKYRIPVVKVIQDTSRLLKGTDSIPVNTTFPFVLKALGYHKFPSEWEVPYGKPTNPSAKILYGAYDFYSKFADDKTTIGQPKIKKLTFLGLPFSWFQSFDDPIFYTYKNSKLRLPNFGPYECYYHTATGNYQINELGKNDSKEQSDKIDKVGSLIFVHPYSKEAKVLNVFVEDSEELGWVRRYFFIKADGTILIYEIAGGEGDAWFLISYAVSVSKSGEFSFVRTR